MLVAFGSFAAASAQQLVQIPRIGYVTGRGAGFESFQNGLRDLGYVEGKNIVVEYRIAEGKLDRIPDFVAELVQSNVDVIVSTILPPFTELNRPPRQFPS
jgi:putative ABC transport system substrate-binding protein